MGSGARETDKTDSWMITAEIAGYGVTTETFVKSRPVRDTISGWYASA